MEGTLPLYPPGPLLHAVHLLQQPATPEVLLRWIQVSGTPQFVSRLNATSHHLQMWQPAHENVTLADVLFLGALTF